jgi:hypothetical protein
VSCTARNLDCKCVVTDLRKNSTKFGRTRRMMEGLENKVFAVTFRTRLRKWAASAALSSCARAPSTAPGTANERAPLLLPPRPDAGRAHDVPELGVGGHVLAAELREPGVRQRDERHRRHVHRRRRRPHLRSISPGPLCVMAVVVALSVLQNSTLENSTRATSAAQVVALARNETWRCHCHQRRV